MTARLTIGIVTYNRSSLFSDLLESLKPAIRQLAQPVLIIVVNNSGPATRDATQALLDRSDLAEVCSIRLLDSNENNISVARNLILEACETRLLAFIDDDERPHVDWLVNLLDQYALDPSAAVAGPVLARFPPGTAQWVRAVDLHNTRHRSTGDSLTRAGAGNCLLDLHAIGELRFDVALGKSGGEDSEFFECLVRSGGRVVWRADAVADETIPQDRATARFMIFRFVKQGNIYSSSKLKSVSRSGRWVFYLRAWILAMIGIVAGALMWPISPSRCARLWKGGFTNLGKLLQLRGDLYG